MHNPSPPPQRAISLHLSRTFTRGIDDKRHRLPMRLKPPPRKLLQIVRAGNQSLTRKHIPPKILRHLWRNLVLQIPRINRTRSRPRMTLNDEVMMNPRDMVAAHGLSHHRRNPRTKRTFQILKLNDRDLLTTRRPEHRGIFERSSPSRRHRSLRTHRNNRSKDQNQNQTIHNATHSSRPPAHASFQSTTRHLTPTIKLTQIPTVRRKPDCTI
jgi:hypothetical protein